MSEPTTELLLRVNGVQAAFGIELGFASPRADEGRSRDPYRQANASFSLLQRREGKVVRHTLIDAGMGVVPSLLELERTHGAHVVHEVFITHPHFDHFAQIDWLSMALLRNRRPDQPRPLPIYATRACWENGPNHMFQYLAERSDFRPAEPGADVELDDVTVRPFVVDHGPKAPGAVGLVVEHGRRKIIFSGDFLHVPDEDNPLFSGADVCFLDANTWHPADWTWHRSVLGDLELVRKWRCRRAYLVHYSGYEDLERPEDPIHGPMDLARFRRELRRAAPDLDVQPAVHGMVLGDDTPWPEG